MKKNQTFEAAMSRLDFILDNLNNPDTPLDDSLKLFAEGSELLAYCNNKLEDAKLTITTLFPNKPDVNEVEDGTN